MPRGNKNDEPRARTEEFGPAAVNRSQQSALNVPALGNWEQMGARVLSATGAVVVVVVAFPVVVVVGKEKSVTRRRTASVDRGEGSMLADNPLGFAFGFGTLYL